MITIDEIIELGESIGIDWDAVDFSPEQLQVGYEVELEHGSVDEDTNVTDDDPETTAKIAWAHLKESADYYDKLKEMEGEMDRAIDREARITFTPKDIEGVNVLLGEVLMQYEKGDLVGVILETQSATDSLWLLRDVMGIPETLSDEKVLDAIRSGTFDELI